MPQGECFYYFYYLYYFLFIVNFSGRGTSLWPGAHLTENSVVTTVSQHFRVATETATHFSTVRTIRGRGITRIREPIPVVRHVRTFPR